MTLPNNRLRVLLLAFTSLLAACAAPLPGFERAMQAVERSDDSLAKLAGSLPGLENGLEDLRRATAGSPGEVQASERLYGSYLDRVLSARDATMSGLSGVKESIPPFLEVLESAAEALPPGAANAGRKASITSLKDRYRVLETTLDGFSTSLGDFATEAAWIRSTLGDTTHGSDITAIRPRIEGLIKRGETFRTEIRGTSDALESFRRDLAAHRGG